MNIEPTEKDLHELAEAFGIPSNRFDDNRQWLVREWEAAIISAVRAGLASALRYRVSMSRSQAPSAVQKDGWFP